MIIILIGGWLVNISVRMMWLYHLIVLLPMFCVMIMPTPPQQEDVYKRQIWEQECYLMRLNVMKTFHLYVFNYHAF